MEVKDDELSTTARLAKESRRLNLEEARRAALANLDQQPDDQPGAGSDTEPIAKCSEQQPKHGCRWRTT